MDQTLVDPRQPRTKRRAWRIVAAVLAVIGLLVAGLYAAVVVAFPPARLAVLLAEQVKAATGRDFSVDGGLAIHILPTIAVHAGDIVLGNADWGSRPEMLRVRHAAFEVSLKALLERQIRVLRVDVEGVDALLESDGSGRFNWQFTPRRKAAPDATVQPQDPDARALTFAFDRLGLADVHVTYRDGIRAAARSLAVESLELRRRGDSDRLAAVFAIGPQRWKAEGEVGDVAMLLSGEQDWPFQLQLATAGAVLKADGKLGLGARAGTATVDIVADVSAAAALAPWLAADAALPLPLALRTRLHLTAKELRADPLHLSLAGQAIDGRATLHDEKPRSRLEAELSAPEIDLAKLGFGTAAAKPEAAAPQAGGLLFPDTPLPLDAGPDLTLQLALKVGQLHLPGLLPLSAFELRLQSTPDRLLLDGLQFGFAGGQIRGQMTLARSPAAPPQLDLSFDATSLSVETLVAATGNSGLVRGGHADLSAKLALAGNTPKDLAASATGELLFSAADVALTGSAAALDRNVIGNLLRRLNPGPADNRALVVECAVANLPLRKGVAVVDRSIAMETREVAVVASGTLDLVNQTIRLVFQPQVKKGLGLNAANLAQLLVLSGPLQDPQIGVDAAGAAREAGNVGVAVATGGLSLLIPRVVKGPKGQQHACGQAAGETAERAGADEKPRSRLRAR